MQYIGQDDVALIRAERQARAWWAVLGALAVALPALWMWGFTVDDALISVRFARHLAVGAGWRFNAHGTSTDGVTPLPWPILLTPLARGDPLVVLWRVKALGYLASTGAGAVLGSAMGAVRAAPSWARATILVTLALCVPMAAYGPSGMETPVATLLATGAAVATKRERRAAILAGLAASFRPEMAPWAVALAIGAATLGRGNQAARISFAGALAIGPFALCAIVRALAWGRAGPLSLLAKPSGVALGLAYAGAGLVVTLVPIMVLAPLALCRSARALVIVVAALAHTAAIIAVGGDWMPYARLFVPIVPSLAFAGCLASERARWTCTAVRSTVAVVLGATLVARGGTSGRTVGADRAALVISARPWLAGATRVAALDVGWVGAATEAEIFDLAGVTDPEVAALPGGHTSKRIDAMFLLARAPDALLLYTASGLPDGHLEAWRDARYSRAVEARLARDPVIARHFTPTSWLALSSSGAGYVLLRAVAGRDPDPKGLPEFP